MSIAGKVLNPTITSAWCAIPAAMLRGGGGGGGGAGGGGGGEWFFGKWNASCVSECAGAARVVGFVFD